MAEFTDDDVTRLAEWAHHFSHRPMAFARYLLEQGVTLPPPQPEPDPDVVVARGLRDQTYPAYVGHPFPDDYVDRRMLAAVRDLFPPEALTQAAAKVQEAQS